MIDFKNFNRVRATPQTFIARCGYPDIQRVAKLQYDYT